jgi:hypothetical protein
LSCPSDKLIEQVAEQIGDAIQNPIFWRVTLIQFT